MPRHHERCEVIGSRWQHAKSFAMNNVHYLTILDVSHKLRHRELTAQALLRHQLERISRLDGRLRSFMRLMPEEALEQARNADFEIEAGQWRGPLHGVPIAIKDLLWVAGAPTGAGTAVFKDFVPTEDATVVRRLKRAGAVILGKVTTTEGAGLEHHPSIKRPSNPWDASRWTGVSSSGSGVATAAGLCFGALGTDTGGSIRMPSAACGLTGLKPTWGRVSRHGLFPLAESFDHVGPMTRSAGDAAAVLQAIAGADPADPTALTDLVPDYLADVCFNLAGVRIGIDWSYATDDVDPAVAEGVRNAILVLKDLGATVREIPFPPRETLMVDLTPAMMSEVAAAHEATYPKHKELYGPRLAQTVEAGRAMPGIEVAKAHLARARFRGRMRAMFDEIDLCVIPGLPLPAPRLEAVEKMLDDWDALSRNLLRYAFPINATGNPTLNMPSGFSKDGLPVSVQLVARHLDEPLLIRAGRAFQSVTDFHTRHPEF